MCFAALTVAAAAQQRVRQPAAAAWLPRAAVKRLALARVPPPAAKPLTVSRPEPEPERAVASAWSAAALVAGRAVPRADPDDDPRDVLGARARLPPVGVALASGLAAARPGPLLPEVALACVRAVGLPEPALAVEPACAVAAAPEPAAEPAASARRPVAGQAVSVQQRAAAVVVVAEPDAAPAAAVPAVLEAAAEAAQSLAARASPALYRAVLPASSPDPAAGSRPAPKGSARPLRSRRGRAGAQQPAPAVRCWLAEASGSSCLEMLRGWRTDV